ncbi:IclR family transcriptional regulator [Caulobacter sp. RHG1]|uniref:IclR family transcriptional regulator n=1 Tax=Caulobacter sp. (strain RHG1) TaxID=2545762 RepID=UPI00155556C3|nr:helix-turn-helix domain-containing protein [Caulobacter sp. RHG1]NQE61654.1 Transcriptional regulator, IclR family [Caulobacter sp. RHG1]
MAKKVSPRPSLEGVASAERTLQVLAAFRAGDGALELAELAERTGLVKSTIMRLAVSLQRYGFLSRTLEGSYALGGEIVRLAAVYGESQDLGRVIEPLLEYLAEETEETATFWVRENDERRCLFRFNSPSRLRLEIQPGAKRQMDQSSSAMVLKHFARANPTPPGPLPFYTAGVTTPHVASLSVPVFGMDQQLLGALTLSGPESRLNPERAKVVAPLLLKVSHDLTHQLGGRPYASSTEEAASKPATKKAASAKAKGAA